MDVTIQDAINAFALLKEHVNENGFLYECYNLGISALKTIQDGNYQLQSTAVSRETIEKIAEYDCAGKSCSECKCYMEHNPYQFICMSIVAKRILLHEQNLKEIEKWIQKNS